MLLSAGINRSLQVSSTHPMHQHTTPAHQHTSTPAHHTLPPHPVASPWVICVSDWSFLLVVQRKEVKEVPHPAHGE